MTKEPITQQQIDECAKIIGNILRSQNGTRFWKMSPKMCAIIAATALNTSEPRKSAEMIAKAADMSPMSIYKFMLGKDTAGAPWPELQEELDKLVVKTEAPTCEPSFATAVRDAAWPSVATATKQSDSPAAVARTIDPDQRMQSLKLTGKPSTLAVTNKGDVAIAAPPTAATTPTAMVAHGGDFATKQNTMRCAIDKNTGDILIITTRRIMYGSAEHRAKMIEMNTAKV